MFFISYFLRLKFSLMKFSPKSPINKRPVKIRFPQDPSTPWAPGDWDSDPQYWRDHQPGQVGDHRQVSPEQTTEASLCNLWRWDSSGWASVRAMKVKLHSWDLCPVRCLQPLHPRVLFRPLPQDIREYSWSLQEGRAPPDRECLPQRFPRRAGILGPQCSPPGLVEAGCGGRAW